MSGTQTIVIRNEVKRSRVVLPELGIVADFELDRALTESKSMLGSDVSQLWTDKHISSVLVVDDGGGLSGIFTPADIVFRVITKGIGPRITPVSKIMSKGPIVIRETASANETLQLMLQHGFRKLPVCDDEGDELGLLKVTKVFQGVLGKLDSEYSATSKPHNALEVAQSELGDGINIHATATKSFAAFLSEKSLSTVIARQTISDEGIPTLTDFESSLHTNQSLRFTRTTTGKSLTVQWLAPEFIVETGKPSEAADLYTLAMTIYEAMAGTPPYNGKREHTIIYLVVNKMEPPHRPECIPVGSVGGDKLWKLLTRCWSFEPELRPSARTLLSVK
ncbi:hypothetical protein B0J17DRAFT_723670 [Rhizoctonia solani]|nr:hypothetical protein B0J17DRAFT_723670 [Rhizoctonia solani]